MAAPTLTGFAPRVTFAENSVNTAPQLLDFDVTFADAEGDFGGGILTLELDHKRQAHPCRFL